MAAYKQRGIVMKPIQPTLSLTPVFDKKHTEEQNQQSELAAIFQQHVYQKNNLNMKEEVTSSTDESDIFLEIQSLMLKIGLPTYLLQKIQPDDYSIFKKGLQQLNAMCERPGTDVATAVDAIYCSGQNDEVVRLFVKMDLLYTVEMSSILTEQEMQLLTDNFSSRSVGGNLGPAEHEQAAKKSPFYIDLSPPMSMF